MNIRSSLNHKIAMKLVWYTILFSLAITLVMSLIQLYLDYNRGINNINMQLAQVESGYRASLERGLWIDDREQVKLQMLGILNFQDIKYIQIKTNNNEILEMGEKLKESFIRKKLQLYYEYSDRIVPVGAIEIMADLNALYQRLYDQAIIILFSQGIKIFLTSFFIIFLVQYLLIQHLETLAIFSKQLSVTYSIQPLVLHKKNSGDELDEVVSAFNLMQQSIQSEIDKLALLNQHLETRVEDRTYELQASLDELKNAQNQLIQAEKMASLGGLVAGVAHEINTPVGLSITGITYLNDITKELSKRYQANQMTKSDFDRYLENSIAMNESIFENLQQAAKLVKSFKMIAVKQSTQDFSSFALYDVIEQVLISIRGRLKKTKIEVKIDCDKTLSLYSDAGGMIQIFTNLIINSLIHGFEQSEVGNIEIKIKALDNKVNIVYSDDGKGIVADVLPKIFDPFFTTNRDEGGTGLGMHIIYNIIVSQMHGSIDVKSEVGNGVEFTIILPNLS